ncbi:MAG: type IV toxin-antitoxin system AbiEi family antitoxin domain-containing protein [Sphingomonas sp.]|uniref:type IV toxin-antitoxin system AbiEi family antitoxin domain-containing protein n=1 Tax=Sphingomonas sp. TaxID=28214 RepID=UPI002274F273|nr:type IV toxin-antitoxin system AbiEi family antitoxin domain-containing protein [Sphingomonas sp.]MCX8475361.1 type IV toxin-antitoxin system AbiEi family antitoxin domain-containing protein [Sphingomonas sp.]
MTPRIRTWRSLKRSERQALRLLRGTLPASTDAALLSGFRRLRDRLADHGMKPLAPAGRYVSADEAMLLANLAALQRGRAAAGPGDHRLARDVRSALIECAIQLERAGCILDAGAIARVNAPGDAAPPRSGAAWTARRARILDFVEERRLVRTRELVALGASRENIRALCSKGAIQRVRHGWYAARSLSRAEIASVCAGEASGHSAASPAANDNDPRPGRPR